MVLSIFGPALAGYGFWKSGPSGQPSEGDVSSLVARFASRAPIAEIDLSDLKNTGRFSSLVDPANLLPSTLQYPSASLQAVFAFAKSCDAAALESADTATLTKAVAWHRFLCGLDKGLPSGFFESDPLIHPSGSSYVFLAYASGQSTFRERSWLEARIGSLHLRERARMVADGALSGGKAEELLASAPLSIFSGMAKEEPILLGDAEVLVLRRGSSRESLQRRYMFFHLVDWRAYLGATPYKVAVAEPGGKCGVIYGALCWNLDDARIHRFRLLTTIGALTAMAGISGIAIWAFAGWALQRRRYLLEREGVYQTLAHELRTPISNLKMLVESFRKTYDQLPAVAQRDFLTLSGEVQRLERLARASAAYLDPSGAKNSPAMLRSSVAVSDFVKAVVEPYGDRVTVMGRDLEAVVAVDPYWFGVCVKNLIDNALEHGAPPVVVEVAGDKETVTCSVSDGGKSPFKRLKDFVRPFSKGQQSKGLGLGLAITLNAIRRMGGDLSFRTAPSTFTLRMKRSP